ncbi:MAG: hypothetical protein QXZ70_00625 [Candidatus Bathyarchaeia archaeon]
MTVTVSINDVLANALRGLKGEPLERGLASLIKDYVEIRIRECDGKVKEYESKYVSFEKLKSRILSEWHEWDEERDLFDWEATLTERQRLEKILAEIGGVEG